MLAIVIGIPFLIVLGLSVAVLLVRANRARRAPPAAPITTRIIFPDGQGGYAEAAPRRKQESVRGVDAIATPKPEGGDDDAA